MDIELAHSLVKKLAALYDTLDANVRVAVTSKLKGDEVEHNTAMGEARDNLNDIVTTIARIRSMKDVDQAFRKLGYVKAPETSANGKR